MLNYIAFLYCWPKRSLESACKLNLHIERDHDVSVLNDDYTAEVKP